MKVDSPDNSTVDSRLTFNSIEIRLLLEKKQQHMEILFELIVWDSEVRKKK